MLTTLNLINDAKKNGYSSVLILEDDIEFHPQINEIVDRHFNEVPADWELFQFGAVHKKAPERVGESFRIFRMKESDCLHCYALQSSIYDVMIEEISKMDMQLDMITQKKIHPRGKSYCLVPNFAYQRESFSDIRKKDVYYSFLKS
ncbi:MAG: hypothetical protein K2X86_14990 [Cytophagaceae bacterium]|nr:hypothetical protein [Cytophagaceae bacterium]